VALEIVSAKGAAVLGRPLDIRVTIKLDRTEEDPCLDTQVYFAEARPAVLTQWALPADSSTGVLRVNTTQVVDEPIVTLYVNVGCNQRLSRKFIFFAEMEPQPGASSSVGQVLAAVSAVPKVTSASAPPVVIVQSASNEGKLSNKSKANDSSKRPAQAKADGASQTSISNRSGLKSELALGIEKKSEAKGKKLRDAKLSGAAKSRLKLEPLELSAQAGLKSSMELSVQAQETDAKTRAAAAALWRAINSSPEELLRDNERMRVLEGQLGQMQSKLLAQQESLSRVQADMERQQSYVYSLLSILVVIALGGGFLWTRSRKTASIDHRPWWKERKQAWLAESGPFGAKTKADAKKVKADDPKDEADDPAPSVTAFFKQAPAQLHLQKTNQAKAADKTQQTWPGNKSKDAASKPSRPKDDLDDSVDFKRTIKQAVPEAASKTDPQEDQEGTSLVTFPPEQDEPQNTDSLEKKKAKAEQDAHSAFESFFGVELTGKNYDVQELFDVQEQSEFFITVGQHDQAIEILRNHIDANPEGSPLAYLDLFALFHNLGKRQEYEELAGRFVSHFNARIPSFDEYGTEKRRHLEHYIAAMTRIQLLWPTEKTLNVIAESIFRKPETPESAFSLEAYQDLLLLYGILKEIHENEKPAPDFVASGFQDSGFGGSGFQATRMEALPTVDMTPSSNSMWTGEQSGMEQNATSESLLEFDVFTPPKSSRLGLDIDLAEPELIGEEKPRLKIKRSRG
jgi:pilus assembly protein FimV